MRRTRLFVALVSISVAGIVLVLLVPVIRGDRLHLRRFEGPSGVAALNPIMGISVSEPADTGSAEDVISVAPQAIVLPSGFRTPGLRFCVLDVIIIEKRRDSAEASFWQSFEPPLLGNNENDRGGVPSELDTPPAGSCVSPPAGVTSEKTAIYYHRMREPQQLHVVRDPVYGFPFDRVVLDFDVYLDGWAESEGKQWRETRNDAVATPRVLALVSAPNWDVEVSMQANRTRTVTNVHVTYRRPLLQKILVPTILVLAFGLILSMLRIEAFETLLRVTPAMLFGLWGVREVLVSDAIQSRTWIDGVLLALYVWLAVVFVVRTVVLPFPRLR